MVRDMPRFLMPTDSLPDYPYRKKCQTGRTGAGAGAILCGNNLPVGLLVPGSRACPASPMTGHKQATQGPLGVYRYLYAIPPSICGFWVIDMDM